MLDLHLAIPNNNKRELLRQSLQALPASATHISLTATVVDNASTDGSAEMVASEFPDIGLVRQTSPVGSSANFNAGLLAGGPARYLGVLHEDAYPTPGAFDHLVEMLDAHPRVGGLSPRIVYPDGTIDHTASHFPRIFTETLAIRWPLRRWFSPVSHDETGSKPFAVDYNSATCLVFRREALEQVGLFDESFPIFYEEVDLDRRLADRGWETWFVPTTEVVHHGGVTRQRTEASPAVQARYAAIADHLAGSKYLYFRKHQGRRAELSLRIIDSVVATIGVALVLGHRLTRQEDHDKSDRSGAYLYVLRNALTNWPRLDPDLELRLPPIRKQ